MGTTTKPIYAAAVDLTVTSWGSGLLTDEIGSSAEEENGSLLYDDIIIGGILESPTTPAAGGTMDVYVTGRYDELVAAAYGGGLDGLITGVDEELVEGVGVQLAGMHLVRAATAITILGSRFGPMGIAQFFGGIPPENWLSLMHNNTDSTMTAGSVGSFVGLHWDVP